MKRIIGIILLLTLTNAVYAETPPEEEWSKTFGGTDSDEAWSVQQTSDGGYILAGATDSYGAGSKDFWLLKTNSNGDKQWDKTFGGGGWDLAGSVQQTSDGGYILAGWTGSYGAGSGDVWMVKTDSNGNKKWDTTFGGTARDMAYSIQQTSDGGYILVGWTGSYGAGSEDVWLLKTDSNGNKQWDKTFGGTGWDMAYSIQQTSDGGYILAGATESYGANSRDVWLLKTDSNGNKQWDKTFGGTDAEEAYSIQQTSDGGYILAIRMCLYGAGSEDVWLVKTDSNGNKQWGMTFGGTGGDRANSVQQTSDGGYILAGMTTSYGAGSEDVWLVKTDSNGNKQWDKTFGGTGWDRAYSVQQTSDGGYIITGFTESYGAGPRDVWLVKTDSDGNTRLDEASGGTAAPTLTPAVTSRSTPVIRHTPMPQEEDSSSWLWLGLIVVVAMLLVGLVISRSSKHRTVSDGGVGVPSDTSARRVDPQINEAERVIQSTEAALQGALSRGIKIPQSTKQLLLDAQRALEADDFASAKMYAHKCIENVKVAVKEHEEKQAQKAREQQEIEQLRKEALNQIKVAKNSFGIVEELSLPVQEAEDMLYVAQHAFESGYYKNAKNEAQRCIEFVNSALEKYEEEQVRKERKKRELEQQRKDAAEQIETAKKLLEKSKKLGIPTLQNPEYLLTTARSSFDVKKYAAAKEDAQQCRDIIERRIEESEPDIIPQLPSRLKYNDWRYHDILLTNSGTAHAKNIKIHFSKALESGELETIPELNVGEQKNMRIHVRPTETGDVPIEYTIQFTDLQEKTYETKHTTIVPISAEGAWKPEPPTSEPVPSDQFTTLRTVWDPNPGNRDFAWSRGKPDEYGELPGIKQWISDKNPNIYWFLLKIVNRADYPVTEWNVTLYTEQALMITKAHLDDKRVRIVDSSFDTNKNRNKYVVSIPPELGVSIPAKGGTRLMYFETDIRCEDALKMEFGVSGVVKLGTTPQIELPIREKRFTYACKYGDFKKMFYGSIDALASQVMENLQDSYRREIVQNFTNSFRLIRDFENYCKNRYAEPEILIDKLEAVYSSLGAAEPITKDKILPFVEENLDVIRKLGGAAPNVEAQKERGMRMCERLIGLLHQVKME